MKQLGNYYWKNRGSVLSSSLVGNFIVNKRLVKIIDTSDGGIDVLAYDDEKDEFARKIYYLSMIMYGREDIEKLSEEEFNKKMREQRNKFLQENSNGKSNDG
jgi:hypothetical protein